MPESHDDFYVGYRPRASPAVRDHVRKAVAALFVLAIVIPLLLVSAQGEFSDAVFEYGNVRPFEGRLTAAPYPVLHVDGDGSARPHLLVEFGKHGARQELGDLDDQRIRLDGQLIHRDDSRMIELTGGAPRSLGQQPPEGRGTTRGLGRYALTGEILDSKCYLGVMKPGRGKPHRDCATRCLSGGVPPLFVVTDREGDQVHLLLVGEFDEPIGRELLHLVAEPVTVEGDVIVHDGLFYLRASAASFRRLEGAS